jgi:DNA-binding transcriptional ArsR family regulator
MGNDPFRALAHPTRRHIVERLGRGSATVGEATRGLTVSKPAISKHLKVLEEENVIVRAIEGRTHRLTLRVEELDEVSRWMDRQRSLWMDAFDAVDDFIAEQGEAP